MYHIDHLESLKSIYKNTNYILPVINRFIKNLWFYHVRTSAAVFKTKIIFSKVYFENPKRMISDRGTTFSCVEFEEY